MTTEVVCARCPWRLSNQGKRHFGGFYTKANLRRLWGQIRRGGAAQSCHLTDAQHEDHIKAGCAADSTPRECPGSVILVLRELLRLRGPDPAHAIEPEDVDRYLAERRCGLTSAGLQYWLVQRVQFGNVPLLGGPPLPDVAVDDAAFGLPAYLHG